MDKTFEISKALIERITEICQMNGWAFGDATAVKMAYDEMFGAGAYAKLAGEIYDELRAK